MQTKTFKRPVVNCQRVKETLVIANDVTEAVFEDDGEIVRKRQVVGGGSHGGKQPNAGKKGNDNPYWKMYKSIGKGEKQIKV